VPRDASENDFPMQRRRPRLVLALLALAGLNAVACRGPSFIDEECIKGRISKEQAAEINEGPWEHLPTYNRDADGKCKNCAEETDRILSAKCSRFIKEMTLHDL
jgi:hypothetical protein